MFSSQGVNTPSLVYIVYLCFVHCRVPQGVGHTFVKTLVKVKQTRTRYGYKSHALKKKYPTLLSAHGVAKDGSLPRVRPGPFILRLFWRRCLTFALLACFREALLLCRGRRDLLKDLSRTVTQKYDLHPLFSGRTKAPTCCQKSQLH